MKKRWAFLVGVNRYTDPNFSSLKFCVNDVVALERVLTQLGYTVVCLHDELDNNSPRFPTRDNVEAELEAICKAVQADDLLWVHCACHGTLVEKQSNKKEPVLITKDIRQASLKTRALSVAEVEKYMRGSGARQLILTLDACHSGVDIGRDVTDPEFIRNVYELAEGFALIAASTAQQKSFEWQEKQHGVFTYHLLEGLSGQADRKGKDFATVDDLKTHVLNGLRNWNVKNSLMQEPTARTEGLGDIIVADYREYSKPELPRAKETELEGSVKSQPSPRENSTPRRLSKVAAIKKESLEKRLARLIEDYATVNDQIDREGDGDKRQQLQRKAGGFLVQMENLESEINKLDELN